jgi:hypothetical protein
MRIRKTLNRFHRNYSMRSSLTQFVVYATRTFWFAGRRDTSTVDDFRNSTLCPISLHLQSVQYLSCHFFGSCDTRVYLARCRRFEAWDRPWSVHVSGCTAGRPHCFVPQRSLAAAALDSCGAWLSDQATIAAALGSRLVESNMPAPITKSRHRFCRRLGVPLGVSVRCRQPLALCRFSRGDKTLIFDTSGSELNPTTPGPPP